MHHPRLHHLVSALFAVLLALGGLLAAAGPAHADDDPPSSWHLTRHDTRITVDEQGVGKAVTTIDFDFSDDEGHGPFVVFTGRTAVANEPDLWRMTPVTIDEVTSPTGAPTDLKIESEPAGLKVRIGHRDREVQGLQTYVIRYTIRGLVEPDQKDSHLDEFNWSVVGTGWQVPIDEATATITVPGAVKLAKCFQGKKFDKPCEASADSTSSGSTVHYRATGLKEGRGMQVVAGSPAGTYSDVVVEKTHRYRWGNTFGGNPLAAGIGALLAALGSVGLWKGTRRGSDYDEVVAVRFNPPSGMRPGEAGYLLKGMTSNRDVVATLVDLAVRGHLRIEPTGKKSFTFERLGDPTPLARHEQELLQDFFGGASTITTEEMKKRKRFTGFMGRQQSSLRSQATQYGWFSKSPVSTTLTVVLVGVFLLLALVAATVVAALRGWGMLPVLLVVPALLLFFLTSRFIRRSEQGKATLRETRGFKLYLETAEANQIRFEEGVDIFSRYLPWAIAFDVADRWVKVFQQLADEGRYDMGAAAWYVGGTDFGMSSFDGLGNIDSAMSASLSSASSSSSGGSGGGGGGGFGGGGGGGW